MVKLLSDWEKEKQMARQEECTESLWRRVLKTRAKMKMDL